MASQHFPETKLTICLGAIALLLTACGGGGSSSTSSQPTNVVLSSAGGDLTKYRGTWTGCGLSFVLGSNSNYALGTYVFGTATTSTVMPGTATVSRFTSSTCSGTPTSTGSNPFTATLVTNAVPVGSQNNGLNVVFSGSADRLSLQEYSATTGQVAAAVTRYAAFSSNFTELRIESTSTFSSSDLAFKK